MAKALVEIYAPTGEVTFDAFVPLEPPLYETLPLLAKAAQEMSHGRFVPTAETVLCHREDGSILNINMNLAAMDIQNGTRLMLI